MKNSKGYLVHKLLAVFLIAAAAVIIFYLSVALYFTRHYLPNTFFGDEPVGGKTSSEVSKVNKAKTEAYTLTVTDREKKDFTIKGSEIGYSYTYVGEEASIIDEQKALGWFGALQNKSVFELENSVTFDPEKLSDTVKSLEFMQKDYYKSPEDAYVKIVDSGYEVIEEKQGNEPIDKEVIDQIESAVSSADENVTLNDACYKTPNITTESEKVTSLCALLDKYKNTKVSYDFWDKKGREVLAGGGVIKLLDIDEENYTASFNSEKISEYVLNLAKKYNTFGKTRKVTTHSGDEIEIGGGDYGWVIDKDTEYEQLTSDLESGKEVSREPCFEERALYPGPDDFSDSQDYIEVDISEQHMYYHKDGEIVLDSAVVTGNMSKGNGTPDGVFSVKYKQSPATLVGEGYSSPVTYFVVFAPNVGFHDADGWRSEYGGEIYLTSGSHGCVNMPKSKVKQLYEMAKDGMPVITYYRDKVKLKSHNALISNAYSYYDGD